MSATVAIEKARLNLSYPVSQAVLGGLILSSFFFYNNYLLNGYWLLYHFKPGTDTIEPLIIHWPGLLYPYHWMYSYFGIGVVACLLALVQVALALVKRNDSRKLKGFKFITAIQIVMGLTLIGLLIWYLAAVEPHAYLLSRQAIAANGGHDIIFHGYQWERWLLSWKIFSFSIGVVMTGLGVRKWLVDYSF